MVNFHRKEILDGLDDSPGVHKKEYITSGFEAAKATIDLMRKTFKALPPEEMLQTFLDTKKKDQDITDALWSRYGDGTIAAMQNGTHLLAVLWESAWVAGGGEGQECEISALEFRARDGDLCVGRFLTIMHHSKCRAVPQCQAQQGKNRIQKQA